jgi:hypothetical protein
MVVGAGTVAALFEKVDFIPPDKQALEAAEAAAGAPATTGASATA